MSSFIRRNLIPKPSIVKHVSVSEHVELSSRPLKQVGADIGEDPLRHDVQRTLQRTYYVVKDMEDAGSGLNRKQW